ncbi:MAG: FMN-binding negative transcriptional regulator [Pseudogulbenkiania sp.]|nr:FMN-binding negative transcriptional regulator [Pseudogulbenkiania sp.]
MHCPGIFREDRLDALFALMRAYPLATLVTAGAGGLMANLIPFSLIEAGEKGTLRAHLARGNAQLDALREGGEALVIFQGPESYITPSWYASKAEHGEVVPTWNYAVVQARGTPTVIEDRDWLLAQIEHLTTMQESVRPTPWKVSDAPASYIEKMVKGVVGVEIPIERIEGKWKVSQNRPHEDRQGVQDGLRQEGLSEEMARLVANKGPAAGVS